MNLFNYLMGNTPSIKKVNYEDVQSLQKKTIRGVLINTLSSDFQSCLISGTVPINQEEKMMNELDNAVCGLYFNMSNSSCVVLKSSAP